MSATYNELLDATIQHLEDLKSRGVKHVSVSPETLRNFSQSPQKSFQPAVSNIQPPKSKVEIKISSAAASGTVTPKQSEARQSSTPEKTAAFAALRDRALACVKCSNLASSRKNVVFGVGN